MESDGSIRDDLLTKQELMEKFDWLDIVVVFIMLLISAAIGIFYWYRGQKNSEEFLMASRSMTAFPVSMSLFASFMSAIGLLGTPADVYVYGTQYWIVIICYPLVMYTAIKFFIPVFYELKVATSYEYLHLRFGLPVRLIAASGFLLHMVLYMAIVVYTPSLALAQVTGISVDVCCAIIFAVCIFYTSIGGLKAVIWSDVFQAVVMLGSFLAVTWKGNNDIGGSSEVFQRNYVSERVELLNFDPDIRVRHSVWSLLGGGFFLWCSISCVNQAMVQRYLSCATEADACKAARWNAFGSVFLVSLTCYAGMVAYAYYYDCDPIKTNQIDSPDQIFPHFVLQIMGDTPCVPGLFVAGVFSGSLSTVSSGLSAIATVALKDFVTAFNYAGAKFTLTPKKEIWMPKLLTLAFGILGYGLVFAAQYLPGVLQASHTVFGIIGGPVLGAFTLGMFVPFASQRGCLCGMCAAFALTMWIGIGQTLANNFQTYGSTGDWAPKKPTSIESCPASWLGDSDQQTPPLGAPADDSAVSSSFPHLALYEVSYMWFCAIGFWVVIIVGTSVSCCYPQDPTLVDRRLLSPGVPALFKCFPTSTGVHERVETYWASIGSRRLCPHAEEEEPPINAGGKKHTRSAEDREIIRISIGNSQESRRMSVEI